ncbi:hypothetical protein [Reichenbachiella ulvae]|uniref:Uncharacterized protein n=1 Tax=Reichenbachiella ulvae TaxID=2980104 RepID=A0ABT3CXJ9_9BACT|nr:hypothetical protein [Reichenbachiella ulvae]MCV9388431.1 hypothetical protein [Reichenbachiella ulvae]
MDLQTSKIELAKLILNLDNPSILEKIRNLVLTEQGSFTLTDVEKEEIQIAINQLNKGNRASFESFIEKVK